MDIDWIKMTSCNNLVRGELDVQVAVYPFNTLCYGLFDSHKWDLYIYEIIANLGTNSISHLAQ